MKNLRIANELFKIAGDLICADSSPKGNKDFSKLKKKIVDFCNKEYTKTQKFYTECQNSFNTATQGLECFSELVGIIVKFKEIAENAEKATRKR